ncbi:MAG TPA: type II toxin-antitoxin system prevent-host-death family antitoxin [Caulobacteraceae bacterium]|nr:type II toxin-antitoxin system prevent-host-death family antitoxin [Caulobacteraceae bacterium]
MPTNSSRAPQTISAADANRRFSEVLRHVREGESYVVTSRGKPVARIEPLKSDDEAEQARREEAWSAFLAELMARPAMNLGKFNRDEAYD